MHGIYLLSIIRIEHGRRLLLLHALALDQASLLILGLRPPRPFRRHIDTIILFLLALLLGLVDRRGLMLSWRVHRIQNEWCRACVDELMLSPSGNNDQVSSFDFLVDSGNGGFAFAGGEGQYLVNSVLLERCQGVSASFPGWTNLIANVSIHRYGH